MKRVTKAERFAWLARSDTQVDRKCIHLGNCAELRYPLHVWRASSWRNKKEIGGGVSALRLKKAHAVDAVIRGERGQWWSAFEDEKRLIEQAIVRDRLNLLRNGTIPMVTVSKKELRRRCARSHRRAMRRLKKGLIP